MPIRYKDGTNFFAINLGSSRTWFLRLFAGSRRKSFVARLPIAQVEPLVSGFQAESVTDNPEKTRIYFSSASDVDDFALSSSSCTKTPSAVSSPAKVTATTVQSSKDSFTVSQAQSVCVPARASVRG